MMPDQKIPDADDDKLAAFWLEICEEVTDRLRTHPAEMGEAIRRQANLRDVWRKSTQSIGGG